MPPFRYPGPICQTKDWYDSVEDGTLVRTTSPVPPSTGSTPPPTAKPGLRVSAHGKCSFLNPQPFTNVTASPEVFDRLRKSSANISSPVPKADQIWPDKSKSSAIEQEIQIDGQKIVVIRPADNDAKGMNLPTIQQVADALRAIPARQRAHTNRVIVSPTPSPNSSAGSITEGEAGSGEIDLYPVSKSQSQNSFDNRVMHEAGHNLQEQLWKETGAGQWQIVSNADPRPPSHYAATNPGDDFCEFNILYNAAKGTSCEEIAKQIYPSRWKKMEEYQSR